MECVTLGESNGTESELCVKQEPRSEILCNSDNDSLPSIMAADSSFQGIKNEMESEEEITDRPRRKRKKVVKTNNHVAKKTRRNRKSEFTQLPCIVNIKSSVVLDDASLDHDKTFDTPDEMPSTSLQCSNSEKTWETDDYTVYNETAEQSSSNNVFASNVYQVLLDIQSTLQDLRTQVSENSKKIDQLQILLPPKISWKKVKNDFQFPIATDEQLLEFEKQLENNEIASKLFSHLTNRTYNTWREMVLLCLKLLLSRKVAVQYNLNGRKGTKKKFRDFNLCNILVECVQYKFKEASPPDILKRISFILAGARDWQGSRYKND